VRKVASILIIRPTLVLFFCALAWSQPPAVPATAPPLGWIVEHMENAESQFKPTIPYEVLRQYQLFNEKSSTPSSDVLARVDYLPPNQKSYAIQKRTGSSRGEDVVRRILQHESQMGTGGKSWSGAAIDRSNYSFSYLGAATHAGYPCYVIGLDPKRKESELVRGRAWVDQRSFQIRHIEGVMAKNPSWMIKKVEVKLDFADLGGAWLQTGMEAVADVHFIGTQILQSRTLDARVGDVVAQKNNFSRHSSRRGVPATVVVPFERRP
jgi:hypothetical protein